MSEARFEESVAAAMVGHCTDAGHTGPHGKVSMRNFLIDYFKLIDLLALAALAALACAALVRSGSVWLFVAGILAATWGTMRVLGWP